ncbi:MAG: hypothetical protein HY741_06905 [Chloroflexi bacterium]|nr:hypothetical protein [Chloroflexota bacterium]
MRRLVPVLFFIVLVACQANPVTSNTQKWISLNAQLPTHMPVTSLAVHPRAPEIIFAGTYDPVGVYSTRDVHAGWQPDRTGLPAAPVLALLARERELFAGTAAGLYRRAWDANYWERTDPVPEVAVNALASSETGEIFAATDGRGIWTSDDDGKIWSRLPGLDDEALFSILPLDAQTFFAGTAGHGVFVTRNRGTAWDHVARFENAYAPLLARDPREAKTIFVGPRGGLYRSRDAGLTWDALGGGIEKQIVYALLSYSSSNGDSHLLAGTAGDGLWVSRDDGMSWDQAKSVDSPRPFPPGRAVLTLRHQDKNIYAGTADRALMASESLDDWQPLRADQGAMGSPAIRDFELHPDSLWVATDDGLYHRTHAFKRVGTETLIAPVSAVALAPSSAKRIYAGTDGKGVFVSDDGGETWNAATGELGGKTRVAQLAVDPTNPEIVFARVLFERLYKSTDGGDSWRTIWSGMPVEAQLQIFAIAPSNPHILYAGGDTQLFYSDDGGEKWQPRGLNGISTLAFWIDPADANHIWAGATDGLYLSADAGKTWRGPLLEGKSVSALAHDANGNFYVGTKYNGLFRTDASVTEITRVGQGLENGSVNELVFDKERGVLYALTDAGLFCTLVDSEKYDPNADGAHC